MPQTTCEISSCVRPVRSRGWCNVHYLRWYHYGDPLGGALEQEACLQCGAENPPRMGNGPRASYCSAACRSKASYHRRKDRINEDLRAQSQAQRAIRPERPCKECGEPIPGEVNARRIYCSQKCGKRASNRAYSARRPQCSAPDCTNRSVLAGLCRRHHPDGASWGRGNPETRRANLRRKTQKRRALIFDPAAEDIDRDEIGERDGWICGLCSEPVDRTLPYPDSLSASLDHILPLSLGGRHIVSNVQISHLTCNIQKGNRVGDTTQSRDAAA